MAAYTEVALNTAEGGPDNIQELALFLEARIEHKIDPSNLGRLFEAQTELRAKQTSLSEELKRGIIPKEYYYKSLNEIFQYFMHFSLEILGEQDFEKVYGDEEWDIHEIIDPEIFFSSDVDIGSHQY